MAVDEDGGAKLVAMGLDRLVECLVVGQEVFFHALACLRGGQGGVVDFGSFANNAWDGSQAGGNTRGLGFDPRGERAVEHFGVEFPGFPIDIDKCTGESRHDECCAVGRGAGEEVIHECVLR